VALYLIGADVQHKAEADLFPGKVDGRGISDQAPIILKVTVDQITVAWVNRSPQEASQILATKITELIAPPIAKWKKNTKNGEIPMSQDPVQMSADLSRLKANL
jgi:hypothetical protein